MWYCFNSLVKLNSPKCSFGEWITSESKPKPEMWFSILKLLQTLELLVYSSTSNWYWCFPKVVSIAFLAAKYAGKSVGITIYHDKGLL